MLRNLSPLTTRCVYLCLAAFVAGASHRPAHAAPPRAPSSSTKTQSPANPVRDEAKRHFDRAIALYNNGDLDTALAEFEAAYQTYPTAGVLYNIGLVQKGLHHYPEAITAFERYLADIKDPPRERVTEVTQLIAELRAVLGQLVLTITPAGAAVVIDGRSAGEAPLAPVPLVAGHHVIELSAPDHEPLRKEATIVAGKPLALQLDLKAIPKTGRARITSAPPLSNIRIDGQLVGTGAVELELPSGGHTVEVTAPGYKTEQRELVIAAGQSRTVAIELGKSSEKTPVYKRWWLWTAVGAAVAGGTATAVAVPLSSRPEPAGVGTLSPGSGRVN